MLPLPPASSVAAAAVGLLSALAGVSGGEAMPLLSGLNDCPRCARAVLKADWPGLPPVGVPPGARPVGLSDQPPPAPVCCARIAATAASWHCKVRLRIACSVLL